MEKRETAELGVSERRAAGRETLEQGASAKTGDPCIRAENEDDDGYDPYSDRRPAAEPLFERDPWA